MSGGHKQIRERLAVEARIAVPPGASSRPDAGIIPESLEGVKTLAVEYSREKALTDRPASCRFPTLGAAPRYAGTRG
jgi:hypothetical protein